jgi:hypothetical protein
MTDAKPKRRWFQFNLQTLFLICLYFAICSTIYVSANLWLGTLVVLATIVWFVASTAHAFNHHDYFSLGFSVCGWAWLGFYAETPGKSANWELPGLIFRAASFFQEPPIGDTKVPSHVYATMHSLQSSGMMGSRSPTPYTPSFHNAIRVAVCVTALFVGLIGGVVFHFIGRKRGTDQPTKELCDTS